MRRRIMPAAVLLVAATACTDDGPGGADDMPVATFEVAGQETYKIGLAMPALVEHAHQLMEGSEEGRIPVGRIVHDSPV